MTKPELLAPAGDLEKLKIAVACGADAVYIGGENFSLRARSGNFSPEEMAEGIRFAHDFGKRVYVAANIFAHNRDIDGMGVFLSQASAAGADALIISDPGVFALARKIVPDIDIHISTQANNTNYGSALFWQELGAKRIVLARELSLEEIEEIHLKAPGIELEAFVHGAMCISYSGRCLISSYMTGRDANRGECAQPCRYEYYVTERTRPDEHMTLCEDERGTYLFNSGDLCMAEYIPELLNAGVMSFKIEGRVKTAYYVGCVVKAYREAIDDYFYEPKLYQKRRGEYLAELKKVSHRPYTTGFYIQKPEAEAQHSSYIREYDFIAIVLDYEPDLGIAVIEQRNRFAVGDRVEVFRATGENFEQAVECLTDADGQPVDAAPHPRQILRIKLDKPVKRFDMLRKRLKGARG